MDSKAECNQLNLASHGNKIRQSRQNDLIISWAGDTPPYTVHLGMYPYSLLLRL